MASKPVQDTVELIEQRTAALRGWHSAIRRRNQLRARLRRTRSRAERRVLLGEMRKQTKRCMDGCASSIVSEILLEERHNQNQAFDATTWAALVAVHDLDPTLHLWEIAK